MTKPDLAPIHPELRQFAQKMPRINLRRKNLRLVRLLEKMVLLRPKPKDLQVDDLLIASEYGKGSLRLRIYRPKNLAVPPPVLLWIHGGGYVIGTIEQDDSYCADFVRELGITVVSVGYRTAPENPFPAPLEDCYTGLRWVTRNTNMLRVAPDRIAIGGESAGGGLAAALAQLAHDRGEIKPLFQLLIYPMLDDRTALLKDVENHNLMVWGLESNRFGWESYLEQTCGATVASTWSVPARRVDLSGLPPAWIGVGTLDLFHKEDVEYARRLGESGVPCELVIIPGAFHGFDLAGQGIQIVREFRQSQYAGLRKYLFPAGE